MISPDADDWLPTCSTLRTLHGVHFSQGLVGQSLNLPTTCAQKHYDKVSGRRSSLDSFHELMPKHEAAPHDVVSFCLIYK